MAETSADSEVLERMRIRELLESYLGSLDDKDWDAIASCFTDDAVAYYNNEPQQLTGGKGVAEWLHRMVAYNATNHSLSNARIKLNGDKAVSHSLVIATLHSGGEGEGRVQVRAIDYVDHLVKVDGQWKIAERMHKPIMQYDAPSQAMRLYKGRWQRWDVTQQAQRLFRTEIDLVPDRKNKTLTVHLHPMSTQAHDEIVRHICAELTATETVFPGTDLRHIYEISGSC